MGAVKDASGKSLPRFNATEFLKRNFRAESSFPVRGMIPAPSLLASTPLPEERVPLARWAGRLGRRNQLGGMVPTRKGPFCRRNTLAAIGVVHAIGICATFPLAAILRAIYRKGRKMRAVTKHYNITDDLAGVTVTEAEAEAGKVAESQAVTIVLTQGQHTYTVDTSQASALAALLRKRGRKAGKRGRKASA